MVKKKDENPIEKGRNRFGNGVSWLKGKLIAVKSAEISRSTALKSEKMFYKLVNSPHVRKCYTSEITTSINARNIVYKLLLEYASGGTLADLIKTSRGCGLPESDVKVYAKRILLGIVDTHECGFVHRDLQPKNIVLLSGDIDRFRTSNGFTAKIGDYSNAALNCTKRMPVTDDYLKARINYVSPEALVYKVVGASSDIWAFGCVVFEMLTGKKLWDGKTYFQIAITLCDVGETKGLIDEMMRGSGASEDAKDFLNCCLETSAAKRGTAVELVKHRFMGVGVDVDDAESRTSSMDV